MNSHDFQFNTQGTNPGKPVPTQIPRNTKKMPWVKLSLAGLSLIILILISKLLFAPPPMQSAVSSDFRNQQAAPEILAPQNQTLPVAPASSTPAKTPAKPTSTIIKTHPITRPTLQTNKTIEIANTPTGYLNVRTEPSLETPIIGKVYPGQNYTYSESEDGWYLIQLNSTKSGWIYGEYVKNNSNISEENDD